MIVRWSLPLESLDVVVWNEIHLSTQAPSVAGQDGGLLKRVVDVLNENVFEREFLSFLGVPVVQSPRHQ